jgi:2-polyprenyl-3-methyl-5-hydroxy-6-metoxy-1,4-benzoquinol methylase
VEHTRRQVEQRTASVGEAIEQLTEEVGVYATTTAETSSLIGVEMRRMEEAIEALSSQIDERVAHIEERHYVERVNQTAELPLERLDGATANLVNHANGHRGFAAQAGLWFNPPVTVELGEGSARLADVNERVVEIPFAMRALGRLEPGARILDIGAAESTFALSAASLGYRVTALDLHPIPYVHPHLESVAGRFEDWRPGRKRFDAVFLISTIEHVGLGAYDEPIGSDDADVALMSRVRKELLSDVGFLVLTTPYGPPHRNALERTYDDATLERLLDGWNVLERQVVLRRDELTWSPAKDDAEGERGVVMVLAAPTSHS